MGCTNSRHAVNGDDDDDDDDNEKRENNVEKSTMSNSINNNIENKECKEKSNKFGCRKNVRHITSNKNNINNDGNMQVLDSSSHRTTKTLAADPKMVPPDSFNLTLSSNTEKSVKDCNIRQQQQQQQQLQQQQQQQQQRQQNQAYALSLDDATLKRIILCFPFPHQSGSRNSAGGSAGSGGGGGSANSSPRTIIKVTKNFASNLRNGFNHVGGRNGNQNINSNTNNSINNFEKINSNSNNHINNRSFTNFEKSGSGSGGAMQTLSIMVAKSVEATVPILVPWESWLRKRLSSWVQLSGHEGTIVPATEQTLWKKRAANDSNESNAYIKLMDDVCCPFVPRFYREVEYKDELFIEIEDLTSHFDMPAIMDVKLGTRTFLESEVTNPVKRRDLYTKMVDLDPNEPTPEEHAEQAITKLRYMQFREQESSTATLGFRIDGIKERYVNDLNKNFKKVKTRAQIIDVLCRFFGPNNEKVREALLERLKIMRSKIEESEFFRSHEVVGTSLLIMYDDKHAGAWMIDFAKALPVDPNLSIDHRVTWRLGNHEDGYLFGLDNFIQVMEDTKLREIPSVH